MNYFSDECFSFENTGDNVEKETDGYVEKIGERSMYVITVSLPTKRIEGVMTHLMGNGYYQTYYEVPLDVVTDSNGYAFVEKKNETTELNIYMEVYDDSRERPKLAKILNIDDANLVVKPFKDTSYQQTFDDIFLENGWVITTPDKRNLYEKAKRIILDSQGNFGTGYHESTKDCLNLILEHDLTGLTVADIGGGSGVLSIAAALKGAVCIDTYDIQPVEREILYQCGLNQMKQVRVFQCDLIKSKNSIKKEYDWVFLNIGTQENIDILHAQGLLTNKDTIFILSGMLEWNAHRVVNLMEEAGFLLAKKKQTNEWVTCLFK
jgi:ribosomal protein L11 methyltransferase